MRRTCATTGGQVADKPKRKWKRRPRRKLRSGRYGRIYCDVLTDDRFAALLERANGFRAFTVWGLGVAWGNLHLEDGRVPRSTLKTLRGRPSEAQALVDVGLWEVTDDGWRYVKWAEGNWLKADTLVASLEGQIDQCGRWIDKGRECSCGYHDETGEVIGDPVGDLLAGLPDGGIPNG